MHAVLVKQLAANADSNCCVFDYASSQWYVTRDHHIPGCEHLNNLVVSDISTFGDSNQSDQFIRWNMHRLVGDQRQPPLYSAGGSIENLLDLSRACICINPDLEGIISRSVHKAVLI